MRVKEIMRAPQTVLAPDTTVAAALARLEEHGIDSLPVVDRDGDLLGLVTASDLTRSRRESGERSETVRECLSPQVITATPEMDSGRLAEMMRYKGLDAILVVEGRSLVGALSLDEAMRAA